jgi:hypothetical protein
LKVDGLDDDDNDKNKMFYTCSLSPDSIAGSPEPTLESSPLVNPDLLVGRLEEALHLKPSSARAI